MTHRLRARFERRMSYLAGELSGAMRDANVAITSGAGHKLLRRCDETLNAVLKMAHTLF